MTKPSRFDHVPSLLAYACGIQMAWCGQGKADCPYEDATEPMAVAWVRGWREMQGAMAQKKGGKK